MEPTSYAELLACALCRNLCRGHPGAYAAAEALAEAQRDLLLLQLQREVGGEPETRQKSGIRVRSERVEPGFALDVMERKRHASVARNNPQPRFVHHTQTGERRMRSGSVLEHAQVVLAKAPAGEDRVEDVLIKEIEGIVSCAIAHHRALHVYQALRPLPLIEQLRRESGRNNEKAAVHVGLSPQRPETEVVAPVPVEAARKRVGDCYELPGLGSIADQRLESSGDHEIGIEKEHRLGRIGERANQLLEVGRSRARRRQNGSLAIKQTTLLPAEAAVDDHDLVAPSAESERVDQRYRPEEMTRVADAIDSPLDTHARHDMRPTHCAVGKQ